MCCTIYSLHGCVILAHSLQEPMSKGPIVFRLPNEWLVSILSEWLEMPSIGMLDTATSSKQYRPQFLMGLQSMRSTNVDRYYAESKNSRELKRRLFRWLSIRQIFVEDISIRATEMNSGLIIRSLQKVKAISFDDADLIKLFSCCPTLRSLSLACSRVTHTG